MTTEVGERESTPSGAKLEVTVLIDQDKWDELRAQGYSDKDLQKAVEKSITIKDTVGGLVASPPVLDIDSVTLLKYY